MKNYPRREVLSSIRGDAMGTTLVHDYPDATLALPNADALRHRQRTAINYQHRMGRISCADILAHRNQLKNDPDFDPSYNQLVDGRAVTGLNLSLDEAKAIASGSPFSLASRRALVACDLAVLGIARLAEAYSGAGKGREEVLVFHDFSAALAWLGVKLEAEDI